MERPWFLHAGFRQLVVSSSRHNPPACASRSISATMQAFDLSGGLSLHALQRMEGTVPLMVLASLYAGSLPAEGPGFACRVRAGTRKFLQLGPRQWLT